MRTKILIAIIIIQIFILFGFKANVTSVEKNLLEKAAKSIEENDVSKSVKYILIYQILQSDNSSIACPTCDIGFILKCAPNKALPERYTQNGGGGGGGITMKTIPKDAKLALLLDSPDLTSTQKEGIKKVFPEYNFESIKTQNQDFLDYKEVIPNKGKIDVEYIDNLKQDFKENGLYNRQLDRNLNNLKPKLSNIN